jgi:serine protease AprX
MHFARKLMGIAITIVLLVSITIPRAHSNNSLAVSSEPNENEFVQVIFKVSPTYNAQALVDSVGGTLIADLPIIGGHAAKIPDHKVEQLQSKEGILALSTVGSLKFTEVDGESEEQNEELEIIIGDQNVFENSAGWEKNTHRNLIKADRVSQTGKGVTVAVLDSGVGGDLQGLNVVHSVAIHPEGTPEDYYGHGTHVTGIITGKQMDTGVAPDAKIVNVKLGNDQGQLSEVDLLLGLQWVYDYKDEYNIKVVNLSVASMIEQSYLDSPISAAAEQLWLNGVTVVAAAGNDKNNPGDINYAPANDPFIITVGAIDGSKQDSAEKTTLAAWSKRGTTPEGVQKPEVNAPGVNIVSYIPINAELTLHHPDSVINTNYIQMSGTSMAAPMVSGAVALLLEAKPDLTPNQIKYVLANSMQSTNDGAGMINVEKAIAFVKSESEGEDSEELENADLNIGSYNVWTLSSYMDGSTNMVDYSKASWKNLNWLKASWKGAVWAKASWKSYWDSFNSI